MSNAFLTRLSAILIIIVGLLLYGISCSSKKKNREVEQLTNLISALNDTLKLTRLSDNSQKASIKSFTTARIEDFTAMKIKDSTINALQAVVNKYKQALKHGGFGLVITGKTHIVEGGTTTIEHTNYDTINNPVFPVYKSTINNKWYTIKTRADRDSTHVDLSIINSYSVVMGKEKGKWFADVTNYNPYSSTTSMRAYNVEVPKIKQKRINLAIFGGYGINLQGEIRNVPFIGAGISYTILSLF